MACTVPRTVFEFTVDSEETFPEKAVNLDGFAKEIRKSEILPALVDIRLVEGNCRVVFDADLTTPEELILEGLMAVHHPGTWDFTTPYVKSVVDAQATSDSTEFTTRASISTSNLVGNFNLFWSCLGFASLAETVGEYRLVDELGAVVGDVLENDRTVLSSMTQSADIVLDGKAKTFSLQWRARSGTHAIKRARIELWRS
jgi:hypothetical protein